MQSAHLISTDRLELWACEHSAASDLPWLLRRLIRQTVGPSARVEFSTGKGIYLRDFDGVVKAEGVGYVPDGLSVWEVSTQEDVPRKANEDYAKRSSDASIIDKSQTTYVGVSLRRFPGKKQWCNEKRAEEIWGDVQFLDIDDISEWLEQLPIVAYQFSAKFGLASGSARGLEEWWKNWVAGTNPEINPAWLLAGRDAETAELADLIRQNRPTLRITGASLTECIAFVYGAIRTLPEGEAEAVLSRILFVPTIEAFTQIGATVTNTIVIPGFDLQPSQRGLLDSSNSVLFCGQRGQREGAIHLPQLRSYVLAEKMHQDGVDYDLAHRAAKAARSSVELMRKELGSASLSFDLSALPGNSQSVLSALLLLNRWNADHSGDRAVAEKLAGIPYAEFESVLTQLSKAETPIVRRSGSVWFVTDDGLAWDQCAEEVEAHALAEFQSLAKSVLADRDPAFELAPDDRWKAGILKGPAEYSHFLKEGIGRTLALIAESTMPIGGFTTGQSLVDDMVSKCLHGADPARWYALGPILRLLAESSPERFLHAVEEDLRSEQPATVAGLFAEVTSALMGGSRHHDLLWALECLAWNSELLPRVSGVFCDLVEKGFGTKTGNSPLRSLNEIFLPWHPSTDASLDERLSILNQLRTSYPEAAWLLMLSLLPQDHSVAHSTSRPRIRSWGQANEPQAYVDIQRFNDQLIQWVVEDAGTDAGKLLALATGFAGYPDAWVNPVLDRLKLIAPDIETEARNRIWEGMREQYARHCRHPDADWSMSSDQAARYAEAMAALESTDLVDRTTWLFADYVDLPEPVVFDTDDGYSRDQDRKAKELARRRSETIKELYASEGLEGVKRLGEKAKASNTVGEWLANDEVLDQEHERTFLQALLASETHWERNMAHGYVYTKVQMAGLSVCEKLLADSKASWSNKQRVDLFLAAPKEPQTWQLLENEAAEVQDLYWKQVSVWNLAPFELSDIRFLEAKYKNAGREIHWIDALNSYSYKKPDPGLNKLMVDGLKSLTEAKVEGAQQLHAIVHDITHMLRILTESEDVDQGEVARLEFFFMPLIRFQYQPIAISRGLSKEPSFLLDLVKLSYNPDEGPKSEPTDKEVALADTAIEVLRGWRNVPGDVDGVIDEEQLMNYVREARRLGEKEGYLKGIDYSLAILFAHSRPGPDEMWPQVAICKVIEEMKSGELEREFVTAKRNARGVTGRAPDSGGALERDEESRYRAYANARKLHPRTRSLLVKLADRYAEDAIEADQRAAMHQDLLD